VIAALGNQFGDANGNGCTNRNGFDMNKIPRPVGQCWNPNIFSGFSWTAFHWLMTAAIQSTLRRKKENNSSAQIS
jgi:hypothetical protein